MSLSPDDIKRLITTGKGSTLDWLDENASIQHIAAIMAAMANHQGGRLILGAGVGGDIAGTRNPEDAIDRVLQAALSIDPPLIIPLPRAVEMDNKTIVIAHIPQGMPHVYSLDGRFLLRRDAENAALNPRDLRRLMIERGEISFETEIAHEASRDDIDWGKARAYANSLSGTGETSVEAILLKRGCLVSQGGHMRPTNAGILLFGKDPQRFNRGAEITAARFGGETMSDTFSRQDITGTLPDQIRRAETFLVDHLRKAVQIRDKMAREESFEYPLEAARELVVNAVAHRDYHISGDGIRLFVFSNRLEVISPGCLPGPVTIDNIKDERFSRNPAIVQVLADMGYIERLGYGVDRVLELMHEQSLREPEFEEREGGFRVVLYNQSADGLQEGGAPDPAASFRGLYQGVDINPRQEAALIYLHKPGNLRITNSDLQTLCPDVHAETIRRDLADLVTKKILSKMGQKRGSYYVLKDQ